MRAFILLLNLSLMWNGGVFAAPKEAKKADVSRAPSSYRTRVAKFRAILAKEPTRAGKIRKAEHLASDRTSSFRVDAVNFLAETRAREAIPTLLTLAMDADVGEFALYGLGEIRTEKAVPVIIAALSNDNDNIRGNAERALQQITRMSFRYSYSAPEMERQRAVMEIRDWWAKNKTTFRVREETPEEKKEAEDAWERYGRQYVQDINR